MRKTVGHMLSHHKLNEHILKELKTQPILNLYKIIKERVRRMGCTVVLLAEALHYKQEGRKFNSRQCHLNFSLI
jgi:hypothetical protein